MSNNQQPAFYVPLTAQTEDGPGGGGGKLNITAGVNADANIDFLGKKFIESQASGVILPALDLHASPGDASFFEYYASIRMDPPQPDKEVENKHVALSHVILPVDLFDFVGPNKRTYLSPYFRTRLGASPRDPESHCPWKDIFYICNKLYKAQALYHGNEAANKEMYEKFTKGNRGTKAIIPQRRTYYAMNVWYKSTKEQAGRNTILLVTGTAYQQMRNAVNELFPAALMQAGIQPRDAAHPTYFLGDITDPKNAVMWHVEKRVPEGAQTEANLFNFGGWMSGPGGVPQQSYDAIRTTPISAEIMRERKVLHCLDYWNVPTPQEIVDITLRDFKDIPYDWVVEACSDYAEVIPNGNNSQFATGAAPAGTAQQQPAPASSGSFQAPQAPTPPAGIGMPGAPATAPAREFWVAAPGVTPVKMSEDQTLAAIAQNPATQVMDVTANDGNWLSAEQAGLVAPAAPATPAVPATPAGPPATPGAAPSGVDFAALSAAQQVTQPDIAMPYDKRFEPDHYEPCNATPGHVEEEIPMNFSPSDKLTEEENRELARIEAEQESAKATGVAMNPADVQKRADLLLKMNG